MITDADKGRARSHMGYLEVGDASTFVLGMPAGVQTQFVIERAFTKILPAAEARFRGLLDRLDAVEAQIEEDTENVAVESVDEIDLRADEFQQLILRYKYWQGKLANMLGVPPNPYDQRWSAWNGGATNVNVPVMS